MRKGREPGFLLNVSYVSCAFWCHYVNLQHIQIKIVKQFRYWWIHKLNGDTGIYGGNDDGLVGVRLRKNMSFLYKQKQYLIVKAWVMPKSLKTNFLPSLKLTWHLKICLPNRKVAFQPCIFRCYVGFRGCKSIRWIDQAELPVESCSLHFPVDFAGSLEWAASPNQHCLGSMWNFKGVYSTSWYSIHFAFACVLCILLRVSAPKCISHIIINFLWSSCCPKSVSKV